MKQLKHLLLASSIILVAGCAARGSDVVIDPAGVNMQQYQMDLAQCEQIAGQVKQKAGKSGAGGALIGGLIGAVVGNSDTAKKGAGVGAITGTARGAGATKRERLRVIKNCLRNRGYSVLN